MSGPPDPWLAHAVLAVHLGVIAFNLFGLVAVPLGAWLGWAWVRVRWWRWLHLVSMAAVAGQALAGRACILTVLEARLAGRGAGSQPLIMGIVNRLVFWPLPLWVFAAAYALLFLYVLVLFRLVPPRAPGGEHPRERPG